MLTQCVEGGNRDAAQALVGVFNSMLRFRAPHKRVAEENFALRSNFAVGSGGYTPVILDLLTNHLLAARNTLLVAYE